MSELLKIDQSVAVFEPSDTGVLSLEEKKMAEFLIQRKHGEPVDVSVPDDISDDDLIKQMTSCLKVVSSLEKAQGYLYPIIGRFVNLAADRPEVLKSFGAVDITDFCKRVCKERFKLHYSEIMYARKIVDLFPDITPEGYEKAGASKLKAIGFAVDWDANADKIHEYKKFAEDHTRNQLLVYLADDGINVDRLNASTYQFNMCQEDRRRLANFIRNPTTIAYCGSDNPNVIIMRMLDECEATWMLAETLRDGMEDPLA